MSPSLLFTCRILALPSSSSTSSLTFLNFPNSSVTKVIVDHINWILRDWAAAVFLLMISFFDHIAELHGLPNHRRTRRCGSTIISNTIWGSFELQFTSSQWQIQSRSGHLRCIKLPFLGPPYFDQKLVHLSKSNKRPILTLMPLHPPPPPVVSFLAFLHCFNLSKKVHFVYCHFLHSSRIVAERWGGSVIVYREVGSPLLLFGHFQLEAWQGPGKCLLRDQ